MARKKKFKVSVNVVRNIIVLVFIVFIFSVIYNQARSYLTTAPLFAIKDITIDESILFVDSQDLRKLKSRNIFMVDLSATQKKLRKEYPQISDLRVLRRFPDQIRVTAKERKAFAQLLFKSAFYVVDKEGVVIRWSNARDANFPSIEGLMTQGKDVVMGAPLSGTDVKVGLEIVEDFQSNTQLEAYTLEKVDVTNLSKIILHMEKGFQVILDREHVSHKLKMLGILLSQHKIDFEEARYIDLRFSQPVVGRK